VSSVTDAGPSIFDPEPVKLAIEVYAREGNDADTQHAGGNRRGPSAPEAAWRASEEGVARRRYRLLCKVYLHLHKALMRSHRLSHG